MSSLKERHIEAREAANLSQGALAKLVKCGQTTIASIENGRNQGSTFLPRIAEILGVESLWLAEGRGPMRRGLSKESEIKDKNSQKSYADSVNKTEYLPAGAMPVRQVPVFLWTELREVSSLSNSPHHNRERIPVLAQLASDQAFAVHIATSVFDDIHPGSTVIIEPTSEWKAGKIALVDKGRAELLLRRLTEDGERRWLTTDGNRYPPEPLDRYADRILGYVSGTVFYKAL